MGQILGLLVAPNNFDYNFRASRTYSIRKVDNRKNEMTACLKPLKSQGLTFLAFSVGRTAKVKGVSTYT